MTKIIRYSRSSTPLATFLQRRGGWRSLSRAALKGLIKDIPFVGGALEQVLFGAQGGEPAVEAALAKIEVQFADASLSEAQAAESLLRGLESLLGAIGASEIRQDELFASMQADLTVRFDRLDTRTASIEENTLAILKLLKEQRVEAGARTAELLGRLLAGYELQEIVSEMLRDWPPSPLLSADPEAAEQILVRIEAIKSAARNAQAIISRIAEPATFAQLTELLLVQLEVNLEHYAETQRQFQSSGARAALQRWLGMMPDKSFVESLLFWCGLARHVSKKTHEDALRSMASGT